MNNALNETQNLDQQKTETVNTINQALEKHTQILEQVKEQVPTQAKEAIDKAITVSEKGQQKAQEVISQSGQNKSNDNKEKINERR